MNPNIPESFKSFFDKSRKSLVYWEERAILDFTEGVLERLENQDVSKTTLAKRLGVSVPFVTKLIGGSNNFTMRTMVKVAHALGARLHFEFKDDVAAGWRRYQPVAAGSVPVNAPVAASNAPAFVGTPLAVAAAVVVQFTPTQEKPKTVNYEDLASAA